MKKNLLFLLLVFISFSGYSQLSEGFENTTGPNALPSTVWSLTSGNWAIFDNGVGTVQRWNFINFVSNPPVVNSGTNAAYLNRETIGQGNTSEDYLVTPIITIPASGELRFYARTFTTGDQGSVLKIKVAPSTASQTNPAAFITVQTWTETTLNTVFNLFEEKVIDLSAFAGQQVYIMFDVTNTQPTAANTGDRFFIDDVRVIQNCGTAAPTALSSQSFCASSTVADLVATGTNIQWYASAIGGTPITPTTALTNSTYYATQTVGGCESVSRTAVAVTANSTPTNLTTSNVATNSITLNWNISGTASSWQVLALPCNSPAPTGTSTGWTTANGNSYILTGLNAYTCYDIYVRSVCSANNYSAWAGPATATTLVGTATCGGNYVDTGGTGGNYTSNANSITSLCPTTAGFVTTVTFSTFNTEANNDGMYVFNGNSIAATPILSTNGIGSATLSTPGAFWGTTNPGPFTSTSTDGCLTFQFKSNNFTTRAGWVANIVCAPPAPTATSPQVFCNSASITNLTASGLTGSTFNWYTTATGGTTLTSADVITSGTYYVSQVNTGTESLTRTTVTITVNVTPGPTVVDQSFCNTTVTVANLVATGTAIQWYAAATGGTALASTAAVTSGTYYVTQTLNACESVRTAVIITVTTTPASTATAQTFCNSATVANLVATGTNLKWYLSATGGSALNATDTVFTGTYYVTQTIAGCESPTRTSVNITVNAIPQPTASAQTFCNSATVANLVAVGTAIKWYNVATGGTALTSTTALATGTYFVTQTLLSCESPRLAITVTINTPTPTASAQNFICVAGTIANLVATGTNIKWYAAATGGSALASTTALVTGTYYVTQTIGGCESPRLAVTVTITPLPSAPIAIAQTLCGGSTVTNLVATGTAIKWYAAATGGTALATTTALTTGTYYATQTVNTCESATRTAVAVTINTTPQPSASAQTFCNTGTVASLVATGTAVKWYAAAIGGTALASTTALASGTYYATQTLNSCESARLAVNITVNSPLPTVVDQSFCTSAAVSNLVASGTNLKWYDTATGGTSLASTTNLTSGTYYVTQTISNCESFRASVIVTINITPAPVAVDQTFCNSATVADLVAAGTAIKWYTALTGGTALASTTALTSSTYYASETINGCESTRSAVVVTIQSTPAPTASNLSFCAATTVSELTATGTNLLWYTNATGGTALSPTATVNSGIYFVSQTVNGCESLTRTFVLVTVTNTTPTNVTTSNIGTNSLTLNWNITGTASSWQVLALPCNSAAPTSTSTGWVATNSNSFSVTGLFSYTCYDLYVRSVCSNGTTYSAWAGPATATTLVGSAVCGGNYVDAGGTGNPGPGNYPSNANSITSICPTTTGFLTTVTFSTFNTEANNDGIYVFNGNSIAATPILSTNGIGGATLSNPGAFWGITIPGPFTSTSTDGCLTFQFKSNANTTRSGWIASIVCAPPAPTATSPQVFCNTATVTNLTATGLTGSTFNWYTTATGGTALTTADVLTSGTYYVSQVNTGTESLTRTAVTITINQTPAPTVANQSFCNTALTVTNLVATGTAIQWYAAATGGTTLASTTAITSGTYYVTQTLNACESARTAVQITDSTTPIATAVAQSFCNSATVANLVATGSNLKWYLSATGGNALNTTDVVFTGTYYVTQTIAGCESATRTSVNITVNAIPQPTASAQTFCTGTTVAGLVATGTAVKWYAAATGGTALTSTTVLATGTYYASQTVNTCESTRTSVAVTVNNSTTPTFTQVAAICSGASLAALPTASNNSITGTWSPAVNNTATTTYTFTPATGQCATTATMTVTVNTTTAPTASAQTFCTGTTVASIVATGTAVKWYAAATGGTALASTAVLATGTYYASQTLNTCESTRTSVSITVNNSTTPTFTQVAAICSGASLAALPTTSNNSVTGTWSPAVNNTATTTYTFTPATGQCATTATMTVTVNPNVAPTFTQVAAICSGATLAALPTTSNNSITGTWSPAINNTATTTYTFTPATGQCATTATMTVTVNTTAAPTASAQTFCTGTTVAGLVATGTAVKWYAAATGGTALASTAVLATGTYYASQTLNTCESSRTAVSITVNNSTTPTFTQVAAICSGASLAALPTASNNSITGTWSPAVNNTSTTTYTFTPATGQCATTTTMTITVNPNVAPTFTQVAAICSGASLAALPTASNNSITGTWSPAVNNTATTTYTFTPATGQCATTATMTIAVNNNATPIFTQVAAVCTGATIVELPTTSNNAIIGTWSPAISNTATTTYTFTPTANQCATTATMTIVINPQPTQPVTACYETATFNNTTCSWDVTGNQPIQPVTACYETATFNTSTCSWDVTGAQPTQPATACYETATFNTSTCSWYVTGTQPFQPATACYETATFNSTTCNWDVTGTQPTQPTTACYETAKFKSTTRS
ncbi:MAG: hypothetical protein CFE24_09520 [Flavobacterium sp. BFFFF2]|nr:MAG: hypothetical protein CFE24_09520 [Flavobacterium sp. BFFFF2]